MTDKAFWFYPVAAPAPCAGSTGMAKERRRQVMNLLQLEKDSMVIEAMPLLMDELMFSTTRIQALGAHSPEDISPWDVGDIVKSLAKMTGIVTALIGPKTARQHRMMRVKQLRAAIQRNPEDYEDEVKSMSAGEIRILDEQLAEHDKKVFMLVSKVMKTLDNMVNEEEPS
jgi:hypothetical protein